jgi:UDP-N-acetylmuramoylalanine--D-glutamate ligase
MSLLTILGCGETGYGAAVLAQKKGFEVFVSDAGKIKNKYKNVLLHNKIDFEEEKHDVDRILSSEILIKSPGIPDSAPIIQEAKKRNLAIVSDIEFAAKYTKATKICVTGSNGKTTTASLIYHILQKAGLKVALAGNVGKSFAYSVATEKIDYYVLEISSFQLDYMFDFKADIAVLCNISPDHLDRYNNHFQDYIDSKFRILQNQNSNDAFVYCLDDYTSTKEIKKRRIKASSYAFSIKKEIKEEGAFTDKNKIIINIKKNTLTMNIEELALQGKHNLYNSMAAGISSRLLDIRKDVVQKGLSDFQGVAHRLEGLGSVQGVSFINDSKATNVNATWYALESIPKPLIWIVGGIDKGNDYESLKPLVFEKVKAIICLGKDNKKLRKEFGKIVEYIDEADSAEMAVRKAFALAISGDTVLLSPACASFDLFENYEDRGNQFKNAVKEL